MVSNYTREVRPLDTKANSHAFLCPTSILDTSASYLSEQRLKVDISEESMGFDFFHSESITRILLQQTFDDIFGRIVHRSLIFLCRPLDVTFNGLWARKNFN